MNKRFYSFLGISVCGLLIILLFYGLFFASDPQEIPSAQLGKTANPFSITTFNGQKISLDQLRGKPVILNFWASWCVSCRQEAHILEAAHKKYAPRGAVFIGIAINDTREASLAFINRYGKTYLLAPDDKTGSISLDYGVTAVPETFLINKEGTIHKKILGAADMKTLTEFLDQQL
ncbi:redoxin domain-containing protein [bacterium]|nr:redoxin domain-containing protein [bacterium]